MREIKFRVFELKAPYDNSVGQQMYYGVEGAYDTLGHMTNTKGDEIAYSWNSFGDVLYDVKEGRLALMQYTGLKDKNGKEIYEGDIVLHVCYGTDFKDAEKLKIESLQSFFEDRGYYTREHDEDWEDNNKAFSIQLLRFEVIGNIYENPDLLK